MSAAGCLNCGAPLAGPFCARCGQGAVPPYPTLREYAGDAWAELTGWDGRFTRTLTTLVARPGRLTVDTLEGRRAHYIKPLRLYLSASLVYFVVAAAAPNVVTSSQTVIPGRQRIKIDIRDPRGADALTPEQRAQALENIEKAPPIIKPMMRTVILDPVGFRNRTMVAFPKVIFAMVPVFALVASLFYRGRPFLQHLTFALHIHTMVFLALTVTQVVQFTRNLWVVQGAGLAAMAFLLWYIVRAQRVTYGNRLIATMLKTAGIGVGYLLLWVPVMAAVLAWAAYVR